MATLPQPGDPSAIWILDLSSWTRGIFEVQKKTAATGADHEHRVVASTMARLRALFVEHNPARFVVAADHRSRPWQADLWPSYKAGREDPGPSYWAQMDLVIEALDLHRIPVLSAEGFQADDVISAVVARARRAGLRVVIVGRDHDLYQLLEEDGDAVAIWDGYQGPIVGAAEVRARYFGIGPKLLPSLMALAGDKDEAPGVPGIGEKTAAELLLTWGSLEEVLTRWQWAKKSNVRNALRLHAEQARLSLELVGLRRDAPLGAFTLDDAIVAWSPADAESIRAWGRDLGIGLMSQVDWKRALVARGELVEETDLQEVDDARDPLLQTSKHIERSFAAGRCPLCEGLLGPGLCERVGAELVCRGRRRVDQIGAASADRRPPGGEESAGEGDPGGRDLEDEEPEVSTYPFDPLPPELQDDDIPF